MSSRISQHLGKTRFVVFMITASCLLAGCGSTSIFRPVRPIALASIQYVTRCEGLGGAEAEREFREELVDETRKRGLLCEDAAATRLGIWLTVAERIRLTPEGRQYRYDCDVIIATAKNGEIPRKIVNRNFTVDFRCREYHGIRRAIVNRIGDLVEETAGKI